MSANLRWLLLALLANRAVANDAPPADTKDSSWNSYIGGNKPQRQGPFSKPELLALLAREGVTDGEIQTAFFELAAHHSLTRDEELPLVGFLSGERPEVFGVAASVLAKSRAPEVVAALRSATLSTNVFVSFSAANCLWREHADLAPLEKLRRTLLNPSTPLPIRRELAQRFVGVERLNDLVLTTYVDLLEDPEQWVRYNAFMNLRRESGNSFGYSFRDPKPDALRLWREWLKHPARLEQRNGRVMSGIGVVLHGFTIKAMKAGFPAAVAGLRIGDTVLAVDGDPVTGKTGHEVASYEILGEPGTSVRIQAQRTDGTLIDVILVRTKLQWQVP